MYTNERGIALPLVIVIFAFTMIVTASVVNVQSSEGLATGKVENKTEAYYVAKSASTTVTSALTDQTNDELLLKVNSLVLNEEITDTMDIGNGTAEVLITKVDESTIKVVAVGNNGKEEDIVTAYLEAYGGQSATMSGLFEYAMYTLDENFEFDLTKFLRINGKIGAKGNIIDNSNISDKFCNYIDDDDDDDDEDIEHKCDGYLHFDEVAADRIVQNETSFNPPIFTDDDIPSISPSPNFNGKSTIYDDSFFGPLSLNNGKSKWNKGSGKKLRVNTEDFDGETLDIIINGNLQFEYTDIVVTGEKPVNIFVKGNVDLLYVNFDVTYTGTKGFTKADMLRVIVLGEKTTVDLEHTKFEGFLYAPESKIYLEGGWGEKKPTTTIDGSIVASQIHIDGKFLKDDIVSEVTLVEPNNSAPSLVESEGGELGSTINKYSNYKIKSWD